MLTEEHASDPSGQGDYAVGARSAQKIAAGIGNEEWRASIERGDQGRLSTMGVHQPVLTGSVGERPAEQTKCCKRIGQRRAVTTDKEHIAPEAALDERLHLPLDED